MFGGGGSPEEPRDIGDGAVEDEHTSRGVVEAGKERGLRAVVGPGVGGIFDLDLVAGVAGGGQGNHGTVVRIVRGR